LLVKFPSSGEIWESVVKKKEEVEVMFKEAVKQGNFAVEGTFPNQCTGDIFSIRLGSIPPRQTVIVILEVLEKLKLEDLSYCFLFPMKYIPRYISKCEL
jgi:hypothetical protein